MSAPKRDLGVELDPVLAAVERAPLDPNALTAEEALALDEQLANAEEVIKRGDRPYRKAPSVTADIASRSPREE